MRQRQREDAYCTRDLDKLNYKNYKGHFVFNFNRLRLVDAQAPQPEANPAPPSPPKSSDPLVATDTTALKDLKADIESAIQDALKNAVTKESNNKLQTPSVQVDGERAKPQTKATHSDQSGSGSGAQSQSSAVRASGTEDVVTGEGSGSGVKPSSK